MRRKLFTIGYIGLTMDGFIGGLVANGIECLIDTRDIPISRKRGFSKSALAAELKVAGIAYRHFRLLGSPRRDRQELRMSGDYDRFFTEVDRHLATSEAKRAISEAIEVARSMSSCLMCCCPDWQYCHRRSLVEAIDRVSHFTVCHL